MDLPGFIVANVILISSVLSMPFQHRIILSSNKKLLTVTLGIYHRLLYTKTLSKRMIFSIKKAIGNVASRK
jgi:hypothetical protein